MDQTEVESWETIRIEGTDKSSHYVLIYKNKYEKFNAKVRIDLIMEEDEKIKIVGYNINSDGFLVE